MANFYETKFLKENSSLEDKLDILKNSPFSSKEEIYMLEKGIAGEKQVAYHLNKSNIGMYVIRDLNLEYEDLKAQIDFVVVTSHHCYFIECKNYSADIIHIDETRNFEISTKYKNRYRKQGIKSPLSQVDDQLEVFKKICLKKQDVIKTLLNDIKFKDYFKTMVVFTNPDNRLNNKNAPDDIKFRVLKVDNLIRQIEYDGKHYNGKRLDQTQMKSIADFLLSNNVPVEINEIPKEITEYIKDTGIQNESNKSFNNGYAYNRQSYRKTTFSKELKTTCLGLLTMFIIFSIYSGVSKNRINNNEKAKEIISYPYTLTTKDNNALEQFKIAYDDSKKNGFSIIHTDNCRVINRFFDNDITCDVYPLELSYEKNTMRFYRHYSQTCYELTFSDDGKQIINSKYGVIKDDSCKGIPIGILEYDENNSKLNEIGGLQKIKAFAIIAYKKGTFNIYDPYFDAYRLKERGCNEYGLSGYFQDFNFFFSGLTGNSTTRINTTKENFDNMVEAYYCIRKEN